MIEIGQTYELEVIKTVDFGVYLDAEDLGEILLPGKYVPVDLLEGDFVDVFLYLDSEDRPIATTQKPYAKVGEFAYLKVLDTNNVGAFLDWGLNKDILVPFSEQHKPLEVGRSYLVHLYLNQADGRIVASSKIDKFLSDKNQDKFERQQAVSLIIANTTHLGYKAIIDHSHWGILYGDEVFQPLSFGQKKYAFIKHIRPDGKIDLTLQGGQETHDKYASVIEKLLSKKGFLPVHDKSDPQVISDLLGMSKKSFKRAIGNLFKQKIIRIEKEGIYLVDY